jgi:CRP-like cAMP-binding protein
MGKTEVKTRCMVCRQGDPGDRFYVILSGLLKVVTSNEDGHEVVLSMLGPGMTFGEIALLDGKARSASVLACSASSLASIDRPSFFDFLAYHPAVRDKLIAALCERIRTLTDRVEDLSALEIPARLARTLITLAESLGIELQGKRYMHVRVSQSELASMVGASRESVNKLMRIWEENGVIAVVDGRIQILQLASLTLIGQPGDVRKMP